MRNIFVTALISGLFSGTAFASDLDIEGLWWTESKDGKVEISDCGDGTPCGTLNWAADAVDGTPPLDSNNPDPELQTRSLYETPMIWGFKRKKDKWSSGKIYDARSGKTYKSKLKLQDDGSLKVRGCVGPICQGETWTRVED